MNKYKYQIDKTASDSKKLKFNKHAHTNAAQYRKY